MSNRKKTPDLLNQILTGQVPSSSETSSPLDTSKAASHQTSTEEAESGSVEKIKVTYYLSPEGAEAVEDLWYTLRRMAAPENRGQISKSLIVDLAVQLALSDLEAEGRQGQLALRLGLSGTA